jgi:hypothetical protein
MLERDGYEQFSGGSTKPNFDTLEEVKATSQPESILSSIGAVLAGLVAVEVLSNGTDLLMQLTGIYPQWGEPMSASQFALASAYHSIFAVGGSYAYAQLTPIEPTLHAIALGVIGLILALVGTIATWNGGPMYDRKWYPITLVLIEIPSGLLGGKLFEKKMRAKDNVV